MSDWDDKLASLAEFIDHHDRMPRENAPDKTEHQLAQWCVSQRKVLRGSRQGTLTPEQKARLEKLRHWSWDPRQTRWESSLSAVKTAVETTGALPTPSNNPELGRWLDKQRVRQRGQGVPLSASQIAALERLPGWSHATVAEQRITELREFITEHNRYPSQKLGDPSESSLAAWVVEQRIKGRRGTLTIAEELEAIPGWDWDPLNTQWQRTYDELREFVHEHERMPSRHSLADSAEIHLSYWCNTQRLAHRGEGGFANKMSNEREELLNAIPGWVWDRKWIPRKSAARIRGNRS